MNIQTEKEKHKADLLVVGPDKTIKGSYKGYSYEITRVAADHLCGYTFLPENSPDCKLNLTRDANGIYTVHGGLTYHLNRKIGFDTCHYKDYVTFMREKEGTTYKDYIYVLEELRHLIDQIIARHYK